MVRVPLRLWQCATLVAVIAFAVYQFTVSHSVDFIDSGELATVCSTLGIAHPTGYPLFTIVGWIFSKLPIAGSVIMRLNLMAAFFTAAGAGTTVLLAFEIIQHWILPRVREQRSLNPKTQNPKQKTKPKTEERTVQRTLQSNDRDLSLISAIGAGLCAAFSATWWSQSTGIEVYPLHVFLIPAVLYLFLRMLREEDGVAVGKYGRLFALLLGLSFANHMTTVLIAPATLYMFFARYGFGRISFQRIARLALPFILGLALYLYLPIRSSQYPLMDWGHPATLGLFLKHVTGGQYKIWMFSSDAAAGKNWSYFWHRVPVEFALIGLIPMLAGLFATATARKTNGVNMLVATLLLFFGCLLYSINYDIHDIDSYFLLAYLTCTLWIGAGLYWISKQIPEKSRLIGVVGAIVLLCVVEGVHNYSEVDESGNYMVEDYTKNVLRNLPPKAIIFSTQWDFWVSGAFYYQLVEKMRPDVLVIDKAMLRDRPWYYEHLKERAPQIMAKAEPEMSNFLRYLRAFDQGDRFDEAGIAPAYQNFTEALVTRNLDHPIFVTQEMLDDRDELFAPSMKIVPGGIMYRLVPRDTLILADVPKIEWNDSHYRKRSYYTDNARILQAWPLAQYARLLASKGQMSLASQYLDAALKFEPDMNADLNSLTEREQGVSESANQKFSQLEALKQELHHISK